MFTDLVDADVDEEVARELVGRLRQDFPELRDHGQLHEHALKLIESDIAIQGPIKISAGSGRVVALVGPDRCRQNDDDRQIGCQLSPPGKAPRRSRDCRYVSDRCRRATTDLRRHYRLADGSRVFHAREMKDAIARLSHLDLILMDTAGRSPRDEIKMRELKTILDEAQADEVHLVLSATPGNRVDPQTANASPSGNFGVTYYQARRVDRIGQPFALVAEPANCR